MTGAQISPNFDERAGGEKPSLIVLHYTGMESSEAALARLCDPAAKVSAHYFIDEDGKVLQLVEDGRRAWHAGKSCWAGETDINSRSIGIELVNPGHEFGYQPFPEAQIAALAKLCQKLMAAHGIAAAGVLAHSDVAPGRKTDPGELFPWMELAEQGAGLWPKPGEMDFQAAEDIIRSEESFHGLLASYGYDPQAEFGTVMAAFHRHFYPEKLHEKSDPETPDILSAARLLALIRAKNES